jgi:hypothetical protein
MGNQYSYTDSDEDNPSEKFSPFSGEFTEFFPAFEADNRCQESDETDNTGSKGDIHLQAGECQADSEGIDTGGDRQGKQEESPGEIRLRGVIGFPERFPYHFTADETQQPESYPVVETGDKLDDRRAEEPSEHRHQSLEEAESQGGSNNLNGRKRAFHGGAAERNGETVRRQADGYQEYRYKVEFSHFFSIS